MWGKAVLSGMWQEGPRGIRAHCSPAQTWPHPLVNYFSSIWTPVSTCSGPWWWCAAASSALWKGKIMLHSEVMDPCNCRCSSGCRNFGRKCPECGKIWAVFATAWGIQQCFPVNLHRSGLHMMVIGFHLIAAKLWINCSPFLIMRNWNVVRNTFTVLQLSVIACSKWCPWPLCGLSFCPTFSFSSLSIKKKCSI